MSGGDPAKKKGGGLSFLQLAPLSATVFRPTGDRGVMTVECGIDVRDEALKTRADASRPRLTAAYNQALRTYASGLRAGAVPDADYIGQALQRATDQTLGRPGAKLLLGTILVN